MAPHGVRSHSMKLFRGSSTGSGQTAPPGAARRLTRRSSGMGAVSRTLAAEEGLCILDLGATSPANIHCFTERGHKSYSEDVLLSSLDPSLVVRDEHHNMVLEDGKSILDSKRFLAEKGWAVGKHAV